MNVYDSEHIARRLSPLGYQTTSVVEEADLIIVNTCSVREKAEQKAFSFIGRLLSIKRKKPELMIGIGGCVAQQEGEKILRRMPFVDFVFGTHAIGRIPDIIRKIDSKGGRVVDVAVKGEVNLSAPISVLEEKRRATAFVTIMRGCDNYCSYCVVPYVRGREISRTPENIIQEINALVGTGVKEVTLLGQNVNSYGIKEGLCDFAELLKHINQIDGLERIRFTTSHPKDLSDDLMYAFKRLEKLCSHIHLPVQSGSNRILKRMNRKYTREAYMEKVHKLRHICADIAITADMIVGFPGETAAEFKETLDLIRTVAYDGIFAFKYSDRPNAPARHFPEKVTEAEKAHRLQELLMLQEQFTLKKNAALVGSQEMVLVEGPSKKERPHLADTRAEFAEIQWTGRTTTNKVVNFTLSADLLKQSDDDKDLTGRTVSTKIERAYAHSLWGMPIGVVQGHPFRKGESNHAA